jgi:two-component system, NarL family, response regulator NreC
VLADDHELVRRSLRLVLGREGDVEVIAEAGDLFTVMRHVHGRARHVLVLDLQMPDGSSIEAIGQLRARVPETAIVVVTMEDSPAYARAAIDAGAVGYVLKEHAAHDLAVAVGAPPVERSMSARGWGRGLTRCTRRSMMTV